MAQSPKWAKPDRLAHLVRLFLDSGGFCVYGHKPCPDPEHHHYEFFIEPLIKYWVADDREEGQAQWRMEQRELHRLPERGPLRGQFSAIGRNIFYDHQPQYYIDALGISGLTFKPFAKIRLGSSYVHLFVDIGDALKGMSKARRRKTIRHGKPLPQAVLDEVNQVCRRAVRHYLA
ncbi:MAG: hypothetical protein RX318_12045 [bacterium]|nr:hypothetical protein [bacterium]